MLLSSLYIVLLALGQSSSATALHRHPPESVKIAQQPLITPSPAKWHATRTYKKRDILSGIDGDVQSILSGLGSNIPSFVASGVPNFFQNFPTGANVESSLGIDDSQVSALPTQVLNIPYVSAKPFHIEPELISYAEGMETGPIKAGIFASTATSSNNQTLVSPSSTTWPMASWSVHRYKLYLRLSNRKPGI